MLSARLGGQAMHLAGLALVDILRTFSPCLGGQLQRVRSARLGAENGRKAARGRRFL